MAVKQDLWLWQEICVTFACMTSWRSCSIEVENGFGVDLESQVRVKLYLNYQHLMGFL